VESEGTQVRDDNRPPNREIVVYALYLIGGATEKCHTEDITIKCHEIAPDSFSWTKHRQLPDKDVVRVALTDARKEKYGALVEGRAGQHRGQSAKTRRDPTLDGWQLTESGIRWARGNAERLEQVLTHAPSKDHRQKLLRAVSKVRSHTLFAEYQESPERFAPSIGQLADLLRCRVDAGHTVWIGRFRNVERMATEADDQEVTDFILQCRRAFEEQS